MTYLSGKVCTTKNKHRLHDDMNQLLILMSCIAISSRYLVDGVVAFKPGEFFNAESTQFYLDVIIPVPDAMEAAIANKTPDVIEIGFEPKKKIQSNNAVYSVFIIINIITKVSARFIECTEVSH